LAWQKNPDDAPQPWWRSQRATMTKAGKLYPPESQKMVQFTSRNASTQNAISIVIDTRHDELGG
jgi:hypothetical protein